MKLRATPVEARVLDAVDFARRICPGYGDGTGPASRSDVARLARYLHVDIRVRELDHPSLLLPPIGGHHGLLIDRGLHRETRDYVIRHELGH